MMLHGILRVRKAVLHNDVVLEVLEVTLAVRLAQARRRVVFAGVLLPVNHLPLGEVLALTAEDGPHHLSISLSFHLSLLHVTIRHVSLH